MKRNMDLIRRILFACEAHPHGYAPDHIEVDGEHDQETILYHVYLMGQAGLMDTRLISDAEAESPSAQAVSVTWDGYEFLEACRDETRWATAKKVAGRAGSFAIGVLKTILNDLAISAVKSILNERP